MSDRRRARAQAAACGWRCAAYTRLAPCLAVRSCSAATAPASTSPLGPPLTARVRSKLLSVQLCCLENTCNARATKH